MFTAYQQAAVRRASRCSIGEGSGPARRSVIARSSLFGELATSLLALQCLQVTGQGSELPRPGVFGRDLAALADAPVQVRSPVADDEGHVYYAFRMPRSGQLGPRRLSLVIPRCLDN